MSEKMSSSFHSRVDNSRFDRRKGFDRGRSFFVFFLWQISKCIFLMTGFPWPNFIRISMLRIFGAKIGRGVYLKPRVNVHLPWRLIVGDYAWIGEEVFILNFEKIEIGRNACISQRVFLCGGNHDYRDEYMSYRNAPIVIRSGAWIGAQSFVAPGVVIGYDAVATACSVITRDLPDNTVCGGNPCVALKTRW